MGACCSSACGISSFRRGGSWKLLNRLLCGDNRSMGWKFILYQMNSHVIWYLALWHFKTSLNPNDFWDIVTCKNICLFPLTQFTWCNIHEWTMINSRSTHTCRNRDAMLHAAIVKKHAIMNYSCTLQRCVLECTSRRMQTPMKIRFYTRRKDSTFTIKNIHIHSNFSIIKKMFILF